MFNPYMQQYNPYMQNQMQRNYQYQPQYQPQYMQMPQQVPQQSTQVGSLKGRAVTSYDEAKAAMIDLDGSIYIFPDINNRTIYTKQINMDGTASLNTYVQVQNPGSIPEVPGSNDLRQNLESAINPLRSEIAALKDDFRGLCEEVKTYAQQYAKSYADDGNASKPTASNKQYVSAKSSVKSAVSKSTTDG